MADRSVRFDVVGLLEAVAFALPSARVRIVEITYRYGGSDAPPRARPADADAARNRLNEGSRTTAALLESLGKKPAPHSA